MLRPVFDATGGADGFVSIEVSPYLADRYAQAPSPRRSACGSAVDRKNLMIKVPATPEGLPAIRDLIAEGINVNITLLFAQAVYEQVVEAYLAGPRGAGRQGRRCFAHRERRELLRQPHRHRGRQIARRENRRAPTIPTKKRRLAALKGKVAIANAKLAYQHLFAALRRRALAGAQAQRRQAAAAAVGVDRHQEQGL